MNNIKEKRERMLPMIADWQQSRKSAIDEQQLYAIERKAKQDNLSPEKIKELRLEKSLLIINKLGKWILEAINNTLPKIRSVKP